MLAGADLACWRGERLVFAGLGFALAPGGALLLTGPNGSGKSSLLRIMAGLLPPFSGRLLWDGIPVGDDPALHRARLHYVGHLDALKPLMTVAETIRFWTRLSGGTDAAADAALAALGLSGLAALPCRLLSAGQKKRLSLARLVARPAPLWLLDEPTTGLDAAAQEALERLLAQHRAAGGMVAATTHVPLALDGAARLDLGDFAPEAGALAADDD